MFHVIYVSTATRALTKKDLVELLDVARNRNQGLGLTGLLLYSKERFIQVLEGDEAAVKEVWSSIKADNRHKDIDLLRYEVKSQRHFPDWRMGFRQLDDEVAGMEGVSKFLEPGFDTSAFRDDSSDAYQMLLVFRDAHDVTYH